MPDAEIHLVARWRVFGTVDEVAGVLGDVSALARWWPAVYLAVDVLEPGGAHGERAAACVCTQGWPSRTWLWRFDVVAACYPHRLSIEARGDVAGHGTWTLEQDGPRVNAVLDWWLRIDHPWARLCSPLLTPVVRWSHRWAMARGEEGLGLELARRRLASRVAPAFDRPSSPCRYPDDGSVCSDRARMLDEW